MSCRCLRAPPNLWSVGFWASSNDLCCLWIARSNLSTMKFEELIKIEKNKPTFIVVTILSMFFISYRYRMRYHLLWSISRRSMLQFLYRFCFQLFLNWINFHKFWLWFLFLDAHARHSLLVWILSTFVHIALPKSSTFCTLYSRWWFFEAWLMMLAKLRALL